jgi:hypothetical protein
MKFFLKILKWTGFGVLGLVAGFLLILGDEALRQTSSENRLPEATAAINDVVFADGKLWLLFWNGEIATIRPGDTARQIVTANWFNDGDPRAVAMGLQKGRPTILTCNAHFSSVPAGWTAKDIDRYDFSVCNSWYVQRWENDGWKTEDRLETGKSELPLGFYVNGDGATVMTSKRIIIHDGGAQQEFPLPDPISPDDEPVIRLLTTPDEVYVAYNSGEFGGGLQRLDRHSGVFNWIGSAPATKKGACDVGLLGRQCSPVTAVIAAPWNSKCAVAAVGLRHFSAYGQIVEICGDKIRQVYSRSLSFSEPGLTVPFYGLMPEGDKLVAVGVDGLYEITQQGRVRIRSIRFPIRRVQNIPVSFEFPNAALAWTNRYRAFSLSGNAPMLAPRPN